MKEIKTTRTIEEITGYAAEDGTLFFSKEACIKYEQSAEAAAKKAAWHYFVNDPISYDLFNTDEEGLLVFDCPNADAYTIIRHWAEAAGVWDAKNFTPDYIGKRVAFFQSFGDISFNKHLATKDAMIALYMKEIEAMFADKETPETK